MNHLTKSPMLIEKYSTAAREHVKGVCHSRILVPQQVNNYIVRSYRFISTLINSLTRTTIKALIIVM